MTARPAGRAAVADIRRAVAADGAQLVTLWSVLFEEAHMADTSWPRHARAWFVRVVDDAGTACFPVVEVAGMIVATAVGTIELGVPNPRCPRGRAVRLANVVTVPEHRRRGYGAAMVREVVAWARSVEADRVDLTATEAGRRIYESAGFVQPAAPRMTLVLR